jgi:hypothetical protein
MHLSYILFRAAAVTAARSVELNTLKSHVGDDVRHAFRSSRFAVERGPDCAKTVGTFKIIKPIRRKPV